MHSAMEGRRTNGLTVSVRGPTLCFKIRRLKSNPALKLLNPNN